MSTRSKAAFRPSFTFPLVLLAVLCLLFYAALGHYSSTALHSVHSVGGLERVLLLRAGFSAVFCLLLGALGYRMTKRLWPAALVHMIAVVIMLCADLGWQELMANADVTTALVGGVGLLTLLAGVGARFLPRR